MGAVYKAKQKSLNRTVAVKMILGGTLADDDDLKRFRKEAKAAGKLQHSGIVSVHEVGTHDGLHYFSMDYVEGRSLADVAREAPLSPRRAASYVRQIAEAVHFAHQEGILHRDLKPSNVLVDSSDSIQITDFGLARALRRDSSLTQTGQIVGTPQYMSTEQAQARHGLVGPASDVYSIGVILYELLTGRPPFQAETTMGTLCQLLETDPPSPRLLTPAVPKDLETICLRCLEKEPHKRYATARHLAEDLGRFLNREPIQARRIGPIGRFWRLCRRKPVVASLAAAMILLVMSTAVIATLVAIRLRKQRDTLLTRRKQLQARESELDATNQGLERALWRSYFQQARASRWSGRPGQRFASLEALRKAARIRPSGELRDEAVSAMALVDIRAVQTRKWNGKGIVAFDSNLELMAQYASADEQIVIRRLDDGGEMARLPGSGFVPGKTRLYFGPHGRFFAAATTGRFHLWDLRSNRRILQRPCHSRWTMDFSSDGRRLAVGATRQSVFVYKLRETGNVKIESVFPSARSFSKSPAPSIEGLRFSPSGDRLAVIRQRSIEVRRTTNGSVIRRLNTSESLAPMCAWSPKERTLACAARETVYLWRLADQRDEPALVLEGHKGRGLRLGFHSNGRILASTGWDGTTCFWSAVNGRLLLRAERIFHGFSADGHRVVLWDRSHVQVCRVSASSEYRTLLPEDNAQKSAAFDPSGRLLAAAGQDGVRLWDVSNFRLLARLPLGDTYWVAFHPATGDLVTSGASGLQRWPLRRVFTVAAEFHFGPPDTVPLPVSAMPRGGELDADGRTLIVDFHHDDRAAIVRFDDDSTETRIIETGRNHSVTISPDGRWAASGNWHGPGVRIWDVRTGHRVKDFDVPGHATVQFSPDARRLVVCERGEYRIYRVGSWKRERVIGEKSESIPSPIAWGPECRVAAIGVNRTLVRLIDFEDGQALVTFDPTHRKRFGHGNRFQFSPDGRYLILLGSGLHVWDLRAVRKRLDSMHLDWQGPPHISENPEQTNDALRITIHRKRGKCGPSANMRRRREHAPDNQANRLNNLAWRMVRFPDSRIGNAERAVELASQAIELQPNQGSSWHTLGVARYRAGDYRGALYAFDTSREIQGQASSWDWYFQAMAHWKLGHQRQARTFYDQAVAWMDRKAPKSRELIRFRAEAEKLMDVDTGCLLRSAIAAPKPPDRSPIIARKPTTAAPIDD